jgi:hypothetical protein
MAPDIEMYLDDRGNFLWISYPSRTGSYFKFYITRSCTGMMHVKRYREEVIIASPLTINEIIERYQNYDAFLELSSAIDFIV